MKSSDPYKKAKKRVKAKKGFFSHLTAYFIVIGFLFLMNMATWDGELWFIFPMMGWGIGIAFHYVGVFGIPFFNVLSKEWEEKEFQKELSKYGIEEAEEELKYLEEKKEAGLDLDMNKHLKLKELRKDYDDAEFV